MGILQVPFNTSLRCCMIDAALPLRALVDMFWRNSIGPLLERGTSGASCIALSYGFLSMEDLSFGLGWQSLAENICPDLL